MVRKIKSHVFCIICYIKCILEIFCHSKWLECIHNTLNNCVFSEFWINQKVPQNCSLSKNG